MVPGPVPVQSAATGRGRCGDGSAHRTPLVVRVTFTRRPRRPHHHLACTGTPGETGGMRTGRSNAPATRVHTSTSWLRPTDTTPARSSRRCGHVDSSAAESVLGRELPPRPRDVHAGRDLGVQTPQYMTSPQGRARSRRRRFQQRRRTGATSSVGLVECVRKAVPSPRC